EDMAPDSAILEDLLPDDDFEVSRPLQARSVTPGSSADAAWYGDAQPDLSARGDAVPAPSVSMPAPAAKPRAPSPASLAAAAPAARSRDRFQIPVVGAMPFRKQLEVWLPLLFVAVLISFVF